MTRFKVECYENLRTFRAPPWLFDDIPETVEWIVQSPFVHVVTFVIDEESAEDAAHEAFYQGNVGPGDVEGNVWPHRAHRSMSTGDIVIVETPDGKVPYACLAIGWKQLPPDLSLSLVQPIGAVQP